MLPTLNTFITTDNIPKQYGGDLEFTWGDMPKLDPKIRDLATWENGFTEFPKGPVYWKKIDDGKKMECVAVGSVDKKDRYERVCTIPVAFAGEDNDAKAPAATNGSLGVLETTATGPTSPGTEADEFKTPLASPLATETEALQNLTLRDADQNGISDGKPATTAA